MNPHTIRSRSRERNLTEPPCTGPRRHAPGPGQRGFTLLEVMAAILLMAIAFTALLKVAGASTALTQNAANHSAAAMWARSMLDSTFVNAPPEVGHSSGRFDRKFSWQLDVTPWVDTGASGVPESLRLYQVDLEVSWGPHDHVRSAQFRTLRLTMAQRGAGPGGAP